MSHGLENSKDMVYVGEQPWHELGVKLDTITQADILNIPSLQGEVGEKEIYDADGLLVEGSKVIYRNHPSGVRHYYVASSGYEVVPDEDCLNFFQPFVDSGLVSYETAGALRGGCRNWILGRINIDPIEVVAGDRVDPYFLLFWGHDGQTAVGAKFTPIRVVCNNTLSAAESSKSGVKVHHKKNARIALDSVQKSVQMAARSFSVTAEKYIEMAKTPLPVEGLETYIRKSLSLPYIPEGYIYSKERMDLHEALLESIQKTQRTVDNVLESYAKEEALTPSGARGTVWHGYNAVTHWIDHDRISNPEKAKDSSLFGIGVNDRKRAFKVAQELLTT